VTKTKKLENENISMYNEIRDSERVFQTGEILGHYGNGLKGKRKYN